VGVLTTAAARKLIRRNAAKDILWSVPCPMPAVRAA